MNIYIVRHGEVQPNVLRHFYDSDDDLTENGIRQATEIREKLKDIHFDAIYSSPLLRARHTASIINKENQEIIIDERLRERSCGELDGLSVDEIDRNDYWYYFLNENLGNGEDIRSFFKRVYDFLDYLTSQQYENVLVVAHNGVSKPFYTYFNGLGDGRLFKFILKNCEVKKYKVGDR